MDTPGLRIRQLREERHMSQLELAKQIEINNSVLSRIESGKRDVEDYLLVRFANFFNVSTDYILGRTNNPEGLTDDEELKHIELDEILSNNKILFYGEPLSLEEKEAVVNVLKILKQKPEKGNKKK